MRQHVSIVNSGSIFRSLLLFITSLFGVSVHRASINIRKARQLITALKRVSEISAPASYVIKMIQRLLLRFNNPKIWATELEQRSGTQLLGSIGEHGSYQTQSDPGPPSQHPVSNGVRLQLLERKVQEILQ